MITVTDNAVNHLRALLAEQDAPANSGLRIFVENGGCSGMQYGMTVAQAQPDDEVTARDGVSVFIDPASAVHLRGSVIDYNDDLTGTGFRIQNPNAKRTCGCGTSFEPVAAEEAGVAASR
jgi:iron-sulfur cluster assembly protein